MKLKKIAALLGLALPLLGVQSVHAGENVWTCTKASRK